MMGFPVGPMAVVAVVGFVGVVALTPVAGAFGRRVGLVDRPRSGELQRRPMPRSGGYALIAAFIFAVAISIPLFSHAGDELRHLIGLVVGVLLIIPIALVDDFKRLGPFPQLIGQLVLAFVAYLRLT
ncbi:MAG: hypothetical protein M1335_06625, partial [Chloroflexi bacterium]|nr:hypothetical protein [Chloroflexota bacterium]